jgi:hypothetical protein
VQHLPGRLDLLSHSGWKGRRHGTIPEGTAGRTRWGKPSLAERRAAARTARAEARLARTEQQIHELADGVRRDLRGWPRRG